MEHTLLLRYERNPDYCLHSLYTSMYKYNRLRTLHFLFLQVLLELMLLRSYPSQQEEPEVQYLHNSQLHPMSVRWPGMVHTLS